MRSFICEIQLIRFNQCWGGIWTSDRLQMKIYGGTIFDIPSDLGYNNEENTDPNPFKLVVYLSEFVSGNRVHLDQGLPNNPNQI